MNESLGDHDNTLPLIEQSAAALVHVVPYLVWFLRDELEKGSANLSLAQLRTMSYLWRRGPASPGDIAEHFGLTPASVSGLVDTLVKRKLLRRKPSEADRRKVVLNLTAHGRRQLKVSRDDAQRAVVERLKAFTSEQLETVLQAMTTLQGVFGDEGQGNEKGDED